MEWSENDDIDDLNLDDDDLKESILKHLKEETEEPFYMVRHKEIFFPAPLKKGDKIALISPASVVREDYVLGAMAKIMERGYEPVLMPYALGPASGTYSATKGERLMDLMDALEDSDIKAILCTRGGYGCTQLLINFSYGMIARNPKWLIGFSDISALHAMWYRSDIASIHGPMAKHLATKPQDDQCTEALFRLLENRGQFDYSIKPHPYNEPGEATGRIRGGNLAVLNDLADTPYDLLNPITRDKEDIILFLEDVNEPIYKVNRMLWRMIHAGTFYSIKGIIFGQFTDYKPDPNFETMEDMIHDLLSKIMRLPHVPVVYNFPVGHTDFNLPIVEGAKVKLTVTENSVRLQTI